MASPSSSGASLLRYLDLAPSSSELARAGVKALGLMGCQEKTRDPLTGVLVALGDGVCNGDAVRIMRFIFQPQQKKSYKKLLFRLFKWMSVNWSFIIAESLVSITSAGDDKRLKLDVSCIVRKSLSDEGFTLACGKILTEPLLALAKHHSKKESRYLIPTQLSVSCGDTLVTIIKELCGYTQQRALNKQDLDEMLQVVWKNRDVILSYITLVLEWNWSNKMPRSHLYVKSLEDLSTSLSRSFRKYSLSSGLALNAILLASCPGLIRQDELNIDSTIKEISTCIIEIKQTPMQTETYDLIAEVLIRRLCLLMGKFGPNRFKLVTEKLSQDLLNVSSVQLGRKHGSCSSLAASLLSMCMETTLGTEKETDEHVMSCYVPLMKLLTNNDSITEAAVIMLAQGCIKYDQQLLPELFGLLAMTTSSTATKQNTLLVFKRYVQLCDGNIKANTSYGDDLINRVLEHVESDESHLLRAAAGKVLGLIDPQYVIPLLCSGIIEQQDAVARSATVTALSNIFEYHVDTLLVTKVYLEQMVEDDGNDERVARLVDAAKQWSKVIPDRLWPNVLMVIIKCYLVEHPKSESLVPLISRLANPHFCAHFPDIITDLIVPLLEGQQELSEELLNGSNDVVVDLFMQRLSPLVVLLTLCGSGVVIDNSKLASLLLRRILSLYEYKDVRRVAVEVFFGLMPADAVWSCLYDLLDSYLNPGKGETNSCQLIVRTIQGYQSSNEPLYPANNMIVRALLGGVPGLLSRLAAVPRKLISFLVRLMSASPVDDDETGKIGQGCCEVLGFALRNGEWKLEESKKIVEIVDDDDDMVEEAQDYVAFGPKCLDEVVNLLEDEGQDLRVRGWCGNAITGAIRILDKLGQREALKGFVFSSDRLIECLINVIGRCRDTGLVTCAFQVALNVCLFRRKVADEYENDANLVVLAPSLAARLGSTTLGGLCDERDYRIRLEALKVAGVLFCLSPRTTFPDGTIAHMLTVVKGISNMDTNLEARRLAESLLGSSGDISW